MQDFPDPGRGIQSGSLQKLTSFPLTPPAAEAEISRSLSVSVRFNGHFPGGNALAGTRTSPIWIYWSC